MASGYRGLAVLISLLWAAMSCGGIARGADGVFVANVAKAAAVAYARFEADLEREYSEHPISEDTIELLAFSRNPGNYDMASVRRMSCMLLFSGRGASRPLSM